MRIDLNADLGEGFGIWRLGDDLGMLTHLSSANVACGFHAGDASIMQQVCEAAVQHGVTIGAQVGYRDLAGFGRRAIAIEPAELTAEVMYQIGALHGIAVANGGGVRYVKPHGALYNTAMVDSVQATAIVSAVARVRDVAGGELALLGLSGSEVEKAAQHYEVRFVAEAFADRGYLPTGQLVPRSVDGAVITDPDAVARRAVQLAVEQKIIANDGSVLDIRAESLCLHGDTPGAAGLSQAVREALTEAQVLIESFA